MTALLDKLSGKDAMKFIAMVEQPFKNVPHLPKGLMEFLVGLAPWLAGLGGIMSIVGALQLANTAMNPTKYVGIFSDLIGIDPTYYWISAVISFLSGVLLLMAFKPLKARAQKGWIYMFWVNMLNIIQSVAGVVLISSSIVGTLIGVVIGLYILFEFKPYYKAKK